MGGGGSGWPFVSLVAAGGMISDVRCVRWRLGRASTHGFPAALGVGLHGVAVRRCWDQPPPVHAKYPESYQFVIV